MIIEENSHLDKQNTMTNISFDEHAALSGRRVTKPKRWQKVLPTPL